MMARSDGALFGSGFSTRITDPKDAVADRRRVDHTVPVYRLARHAFDEHNGTIELVEHVAHLAQRRRIGVDHVVRERHGERCVAHGILGHQHRMTKTQRIGLLDGCDVRHRGHSTDRLERLGLPAICENGFEPWVCLEMRRRHRVVWARDEHDPANTGCDGLFNAVLNHRTVDERKELFGERFCSREDASAEACDGKDDGAN